MLLLILKGLSKEAFFFKKIQVYLVYSVGLISTQQSVSWHIYTCLFKKYIFFSYSFSLCVLQDTELQFFVLHSSRAYCFIHPICSILHLLMRFCSSDAPWHICSLELWFLS